MLMINGADWLGRFPIDIRNQAAPLMAAFEAAPDLPSAHALINLIAPRWPDLAIELALTLLSPLSPRQAFLTAGELCLGMQAPDAALDMARQALDTVPDDPDAWALMARALWIQNSQSAAASAITRAVQAGFDFSTLESAELKLIALEAAGEKDARFAQIMRPCALLGPFSRSGAGQADAVISHLLDTHQRSFERDQKWTPAQRRSARTGVRVFLIQNEFIAGDQSRIRNDIADVFVDSASAIGMEVHRSKAAPFLLYDDRNIRSGEEFLHGLSLLQSEIAAVQPDLVLMDGNFMGGPRTLRPEHFRTFGRDQYRLGVIIPDLYDAQPNNLFDYWGECADAVIYFNQRTTHVAAAHHRAKGFYWPGLPFDPGMFAYDPKRIRDHDFCIIGTNGRWRDLYVRILQDMGFGGFYRLHHRSAGEALTTQAYRRELAKARLVFNNGYNSSTESIVTGRVFEAIYSGAVLIEEAGSDINRIFAPFVHYMPVAGAHQLMHCADYMIRHEDRRREMSERAHDFASRHYAGPFFWSALLDQLGL